jgi:peptidoglycan hydrolase CwlO-like protein
MDLLKKVKELQNKLTQTEELIEDLLLSLDSNETKVQSREKKIEFLKENIKKNVEKLDIIIKDYNANS